MAYLQIIQPGGGGIVSGSGPTSTPQQGIITGLQCTVQLVGASPALYLWTLATATGSKSVLSSRSDAQPTFRPDLPGPAEIILDDQAGNVYTLPLIISDRATTRFIGPIYTDPLQPSQVQSPLIGSALFQDASNGNALSTKDSTGTVHPLSIGAGAPPVANAAALSAYSDGSLTTGARAFVQTFRDFFVLDRSSTATPDNVTTIAASGGGNWLRLLNPSPSWLAQMSWTVDPVNGSDENVGTALAPLRSYDEFQRRMGDNFKPTTDVTVQFAAGTYTDYIYPKVVAGGGGKLIIKGTLTQQFQGTISAQRNRVVSTNTPFGTTASWTIATEIKRLAKITGGTGNGAYTWIAKDEGAGVARTGAWYILDDSVSSLGPSAQLPDTSSQVTTYTMTQIGGIAAEVRGGIVNSQNANLLIENFVLAGPNHSTFVSGTKNIVVQNVKFTNLNTYNDNGIYFLNCCFDSGTTWVGPNGPAGLYIYGGVAFATIQAAKRSQLFATGDFLVQGGNIQASTGAYVDLLSVAVFDSSTYGINNVAGCDLRLRGNIYGSGNTGAGVAINGGSRAVVDNGGVFAITGSGGDFRLGNQTSGYAWDDANHVYTTAKRTFSWANLAATVATTGFGGQILDPFSGAMLLKNV